MYVWEIIDNFSVENDPVTASKILIGGVSVNKTFFSETYSRIACVVEGPDFPSLCWSGVM